MTLKKITPSRSTLPAFPSKVWGRKHIPLTNSLTQPLVLRHLATTNQPDLQTS